MPPSTELLQALLDRATMLRRAGRVPEAIDAHEALLAAHPDLPDSWYHLGWLCQQAQRHERALQAYREALAHGVRDPEEVHLNLAVILAEGLARPDDAAAELQAALQRQPRYVPAWLNLGNLHEQRGDAAAAREAYTQVLAIEPGHAVALSRLPPLCPLEGANDPLIGELQRAIARPGRSAADRADLGFGLGKALDGVGAYDQAFAAYTAANEASRAAGSVRYDAAAHERLIDFIIRSIPRRLPPLPAEVKDDTTPDLLFVCGMFRSGSSLVERILASHPRVTAGGEMPLLPAVAREHLQRESAQPGALDDQAFRQQLRARYLDGVRQRHPGAALVTDKRPDNFLHLGLALALMPQARVVHTVRQPLDNALAIYFLHLTHAMPYALDLRDIAHWFRQYRRLMAHWRTLFPERLHDVDYDRLVQAPRPEVEALLAHSGLDWDERCLQPHTTAGNVATASLWQVRQPLYTRSSGRWRHYARHLDGLRDALGELLD